VRAEREVPMKKSLAIGFALCSLVSFAGAASAEVLVHAGAKVQINVPKGWNQKQDGDVLAINSPDKAVSVVFVVLEQKDAEKAFALMDKSVENAVGEVEWEHDGKAVDEDINGMPTSEWNGSAKHGSVYVDVLSIDTPADKNLGVYWFTAAAAEKKYQAEINTIVKGLKPAR
jgi:hypothetical protein